MKPGTADAILLAALEQIVSEGTHYPPRWEIFTEAEKIAYPPVRTRAAEIALAAILKAKGEA